MSWILAIGLALVSFAVIALLFRLPRQGWTTVLAALVLGLAGYATQASPDLAGAPSHAPGGETEEGWRLVDLRKEMVGVGNLSRSNLTITADALARHGQYDDAAALLGQVVRDNPKDGDAWLALANALTYHADGALTPAALMAYRRAAQAAPDSAGPAFFVGLALIRQGEVIDGREIWAQRLASMPQGAPGREALAQRLGQLDQLLRKIAEKAGESAR